MRSRYGSISPSTKSDLVLGSLAKLYGHDAGSANFPSTTSICMRLIDGIAAKSASFSSRSFRVEGSTAGTIKLICSIKTSRDGARGVASLKRAFLRIYGLLRRLRLQRRSARRWRGHLHYCVGGGAARRHNRLRSDHLQYQVPRS